MGRYEFLESVAIADCAVEVEGQDLDDLFATAAGALAEVMVDPATVSATVERTVTLAAPSLELLLYDWLSELIFLKDKEQLVFTRARVKVFREATPRLTARLRGGRIDAEGVEPRSDAKAVTFHQFTLEPRGSGWRARVVIDI
ncbi:MAG: archease [Candidatus Rokubacteria bacterium]|nr:archease [Candidatus Rokubacteria bacterium]